jgi:hypothetical protein
MVGEGQTTRKGLLRFVLENEGYDVVAEASSTLELAQRLVIHRPDVVVVDDGIDASAVGMMREVLPSAKVVLVWPRGVTAVGADARLEPSEVMTSLGSTVGRLMGRGPVMAPPRPRFSPPDVIVVPEPEPETATTAPAGIPAPSAPVEPPAPEAPPASVEEEATVVEALVDEPVPTQPAPPIVAPEPLSNVLMRPADLAAPSWTYTAPGATPAPTTDRRRRGAILVLAIVAGLLAIALVASLVNPGSVPTQIVAGSVGDYTLPGSGPGPDVTTDQPGTYEGIVHVRADGSIHLRASGNIQLRIDGLSHIVAVGNVKVSGDGVVNNVSSAKVRVRGNGTIHVTVKNGSIRLRLQGTVTAQSEGVVRIGGEGRFVITHRPV